MWGVPSIHVGSTVSGYGTRIGDVQDINTLVVSRFIPSVYRFISVWQQDSGKGPRLANGAAYCVPDLTSHTPPHPFRRIPQLSLRIGPGVEAFIEVYCLKEDGRKARGFAHSRLGGGTATWVARADYLDLLTGILLSPGVCWRRGGLYLV